MPSLSKHPVIADELQDTTRNITTLGLAECDPATRAYTEGCVEGRRRADLYLEEIRRNPELLGMPLMGSHLRKIRPDPKDSRISGMLTGFMSRVERELAVVLMERAWSNASVEARWQFARQMLTESGVQS